jgi:RNA polymerase sigma factor (sigma-70 family)
MTVMTATADLGTSDVVRLALAGDEGAFRRIVETYSADMTQVCFVICGDHALADDAVALSWPVIWRKLGSLRDPASLRPWLVTIAANQARHLAGRRRTAAVREIAIDDAEAATSALDRSAEIDLANALARLAPADRALLALRYVAGLNATELARATGLSASGTRARLARLLDRMRTELRDA